MQGSLIKCKKKCSMLFRKCKVMDLITLVERLNTEVMIEVEVYYYKEISGGGKNGERKGIGSVIRRRRANRGCINIKE